MFHTAIERGHVHDLQESKTPLKSISMLNNINANDFIRDVLSVIDMTYPKKYLQGESNFMTSTIGRSDCRAANAVSRMPQPSMIWAEECKQMKHYFALAFTS